MKPICCYCECEEEAQFEIQNSLDPHDLTHACEKHIGQLLTDSVCLVWPLPCLTSTNCLDLKR